MSMTSHELWELEQDLREENRREQIEEMTHTRAMYEDESYAMDILTSNISNEFIVELDALKKECVKYNLDYKDIISEL